ncbi:MAG: DUF6077 domain-containing protein [Culicoidibacterales bacterium]
MFIVQIIFTTLLAIIAFTILGMAIGKKLLPQMSPLLYAPLGFIGYSSIFWLVSIGLMYTHQPWKILLVLVSLVLAIIYTSIIFFEKKAIKQTIKQLRGLKKQTVITVCIVVLIALVHGILQVGFWNVDNSMSDNSFYISIATAVTNSPAMLITNAGDGMLQGNTSAGYLISTYEVSMAYLAAIFGMHPAAFMRIIVPILMSLFSTLALFGVFKKLLKQDKLALIGILAFYFMLYFSPNSKSSLNDYSLEEWFLYYNYVGKVIVRYLVTPVFVCIMIYVYETLMGKRRMTKLALAKIILLFNLIAIAYIALSPGASMYYLSLLFIFLLLLLFSKTTNKKAIYLLSTGSIMAFAGVIISAVTTYVTKDGNVVAHAPAAGSSLLRFLGIGSKYFNLNLLKSLFMNGQFSDYWYLIWGQILAVSIGLIYLLSKLVQVIMGKDKRQRPPTKSALFWKKRSAILFFGVIFPFVYLIFTHLPPIVEVVSTILDVFVHSRLVGVYPYEIMGITVIITGITYICEITLGKLKQKFKYPAQVIISMALIYVMVLVFLLIPARPMTYVHTMSTERRSRLKFQDEYYNGMFNYQRLEKNPYKLDRSAQQLVDIISPKQGKKVVMGTINQFFGLSHVRNFDGDIQVVKTRFSKYKDKELEDASYMLKIYFSPWEKDNLETMRKNTDDDVKKALKLFDVNYLVVIKSYKEDKTFGANMGTKFKDIIVETEESEDFYVYTLK